MQKAMTVLFTLCPYLYMVSVSVDDVNLHMARTSEDVVARAIEAFGAERSSYRMSNFSGLSPRVIRKAIARWRFPMVAQDGNSRPSVSKKGWVCLTPL